MYIVLKAKYYDWEGYEFPQILGAFKTKAGALKAHPDAVLETEDTIYEEGISVFLIGPLTAK
jgi:hypothetical protein